MTMTVPTMMIIAVNGFCYATNKIFNFFLPTKHYYFAHINANIIVIDTDYNCTIINNRKNCYLQHFHYRLLSHSIILNSS